MSTQIKKAMVLAAGRGTRMQPLTDDRPKPLVEIGGRALIDRVLDRLAAAGVEEVVINLHFMADMLESHLSQRKDLRIVFPMNEKFCWILEEGSARPCLCLGMNLSS